MYPEDLSSRLGAANAAAKKDSLGHAALVVSEMIIPLESVNNVAYLLLLSTQEPGQILELAAMLKSQLATLNEVVTTTLIAAGAGPLKPDEN